MYRSSLLRKIGTDLALLTSSECEFQMPGAAALKARYATTNLVCGITKSFLTLEQKFRDGTYSVNNSLRSSGSPHGHILYVSRDTL